MTFQPTTSGDSNGRKYCPHQSEVVIGESATLVGQREKISSDSADVLVAVTAAGLPFSRSQTEFMHIHGGGGGGPVEDSQQRISGMPDHE